MFKNAAILMQFSRKLVKDFRGKVKDFEKKVKDLVKDFISDMS